MNSSLLAAVGASLLAALWLLSRRRPPAPMQLDVSDVVALNRAQISRTLSTSVSSRQDAAASTAAAGRAGVSEGVTSTPAPPPMGRDRRIQLSRLEALYRAGGEDRRQAMAAARSWRHPAALPLLRRGLRDPDPQVMIEAARGMELFRGKPGAVSGGARGRPAQAAARPRRVARTR